MTGLAGVSLTGLGAFVVAGQSMAANSVATGVVITHYTPSNVANIYNVNAYDGSVTLLKDPLIGCSNDWANYQSRLYDNLISNGAYARIVAAPVSVSGSSIESWVPGTNPYGNYIKAAAKRLAWWGIPVTAFLWDHGTSNDGTSQASYTASLSAIIEDVRAAGFLAPWLIARHTMKSDDTTISTVRAAQAAIVNGTYIFAGPDLDTLTGPTNRNVNSKPHLTDAGAAAAAVLWGAALNAARLA